MKRERKWYRKEKDKGIEKRKKRVSKRERVPISERKRYRKRIKTEKVVEKRKKRVSKKKEKSMEKRKTGHEN